MTHKNTDIMINKNTDRMTHTKQIERMTKTLSCKNTAKMIENNTDKMIQEKQTNKIKQEKTNKHKKHAGLKTRQTDQKIKKKTLSFSLILTFREENVKPLS